MTSEPIKQQEISAVFAISSEELKEVTFHSVMMSKAKKNPLKTNRETE